MNCPFCDSDSVRIKSEEKTREFRKEKFRVHEGYFFCNSCKNEFTTTEQDSLVVNQVYNLYREKHNILFPTQIKKIRDQYKLSASKMSQILGIGVNQYRNYENGEVPNDSNNSLLLLIQNPIEFKNLVTVKKDLLKDSDYKKLIARLDDLIKSSEDCNFLNHIVDFNNVPNRFSGYQVPSIEKLHQMILFFLDNAQFSVKLNKLLFYSDFLCYKRSGYSISGFKYAAIDRGPVVDNYAFLFDYMKNKDMLETTEVEINNEIYERFVDNSNFNPEFFNQTELTALEEVKFKFASRPTKELMKLSHDELGWEKNFPKKSIIDYQKYAFQLKHL